MTAAPPRAARAVSESSRRARPAPSRPVRSHGRGGRAWAIAFLTPAAVMIVVFALFPLVDTVGMSLTDYNGLRPGEFVGLDNYAAIAANETFLVSFGNSLLIAAACAVALTLLPLPVAYWIHSRILFGHGFRALLYLPVVLPIIVSAVAWKWILDERGLLNQILMAVGAEPVGWLSDPKYALWSVVIVIVWRSFGMYLLIYLAYIVSVPDEVLEAASVDGAGSIRKFFSIIVPLLKPSILLCAVISVAGGMRAFDEIYVLTGGGPLNASKNVAYLIWETAFDRLRFGEGAAMAVILILVVAAVVAGMFALARRRNA